MASVSEQFTKDGRRFYKIRVRRGRGQPVVTTRWYAPEGWSEKAIQRGLNKAVSEFESSVSSGQTVTAKERKKAEETALAEQLAEQAKIQTFQQYTDNVYLPSLAVTAKRHTLSNFKGNLKNHIYPRIGQMKLPEITTAEIKALLLAEQANLSLDSVVKLYCILSLVFKAAYQEDLIPRNPMDKVNRPKPKAEETIDDEPESYTAEETIKILECLESEPYQWQCYIRLLVDTGCRRGEACGLQWQDINFDECSVFFRRQLCYTPENGVYVDTLKNRRSRTVYIDSEVMSMLKALKEYKYGKKKIIRIDEKKPEKEKPDERYVFTQILSQSKDKTVYSDEPIHPDSPTRYFKKFGEKYDIEHFHPHKMRHTQASVSITNGADVASVSAKLGHSNTGVTLRFYVHASPESQKRASDVFRAALIKAATTDEEKAINEE